MSRVVEAIRAFPGPVSPGVAAVSGGADSVALLRGLVEADLGPVTVAHFNHRLRGAESDGDEGFVRELAMEMGLDFRSGSADVATEAVGSNLEATARRLRYDWLARTAADVGAAWVATGHTADDQAETVLHRLIRGTGLQGLRGIAPDRELAPGVRLLRPLLTADRSDVLTYLAGLGQPFREDATNLDRTLTRNRIRHELLPLLRTFNPQVVATLGRLVGQVSDVFAAQEESAAGLLAVAELPRAGPWVVLSAESLASTSVPTVREIFRQVWQREGWSRNGMTFDHWERLLGIARGDPSSADFPGGVHVRRVGRVVQLSRRS